MIARSIGTPTTPSSSGSTSGAMRRTKSLVTQPARNTFVRAGSVAMLPAAGDGSRGSLRSRVTIGQPQEARSLLDKWPTSRTTSKESFDKEKAPVMPTGKPHVEASSPGSETVAVTLARKYHLTLAETKHVVSAFKDARKNSAGGIDRADFRLMLCSIFDVSEINHAVLELAHRQTGMRWSANLDDFMAWYVQNMFTLVNALNASQDLQKGNVLTYTLSEKHMVTVRVIDKIKHQFDKFDLDRSGEIDFEEFKGMMCILLKTNKDALSDVRLRKFWQEIEKDAAGLIDFEGFTAWYLKFFNIDSNGDDDCPVEAMHLSFNPSLQRQSFLDNLVF